MDVGQLEAEVKKNRGFYVPEIQMCGKPKVKYQSGDVFFFRSMPPDISLRKNDPNISKAKRRRTNSF